MRHAVFNESLRGIRTALPLLAGIIPVALILGTQASHTGMNPATVAMMCGLNFAGGSEFAAISLWSAVPPTMLIILTTWLINSRHIIMGATLTPYIEHLPRRQIFPLLFLMTDESWALVMQDIMKKKAQGEKTPQAYFSIPFYTALSVTFWAIWVFFCTLGSVVGQFFGNLNEWGFAMAFPATFLSILASLWPGWRNTLPWVVALIVAALASHYLSGGWYVCLGTLAGLACAWLSQGESHVC